MPIFRLTDDLIFPPPNLAGPKGLLAVGGDLSSNRLLLAYKLGIFPWYSDDDPILWWSPDPRLVLYLDQLKISRSLARTLRKSKFQVTFDTDFPAVIESCARFRGKNREGTWITEAMMEAYLRLHKLGFAHSVETRHGGQLVGGLYGVSLGRAFFGESMFSVMNDASKVALVYLRNFLRERHFDFIDCQMPTDHLMRFGAKKVARDTFLNQLDHSLKFSSLTGSWGLDRV
jgi:leucyl/phenylalanyl-tRNA--protein transferase